ncbi:MAG TPA: tetratricopeptide repeat protein [Allosphingosinicella sp.]|nr:tetratricopeptide repeat protein [Allosphingosinicella sp.]
MNFFGFTCWQRLVFAGTASALLAGCASTGYLLDHRKSSKTALAAAELTRYGLSPDQANCVAARLGRNLNIWQLRQLIAAGQLAPAEVSLGRFSALDLARSAAQVRDREVPVEVPQALAACGVPLAPPKPLPLRTAAPEPPTPAAEAKPAESAPSNGPRDYRPSADLLGAIGAYERKDYAASARLALKAAQEGDSGAHQFLGGLYAFGRGVPADPAKAARHYAVAAEQGWSEAMNNLGKAYETGQGVPRDQVQALKWYILASRRATEDDRVVTANMNGLLRTISVEDINKAADLARQWEQAHRR